MTTAAASPSTSTSSTALDKRRRKWLDAQQVASEAAGALALLEQQLDAGERQRQTDEADLKAAAARQVELEKAIKTSSRQREELRRARKRAARDAKKAGQRAKAAEAKFDKALLADMVQKHKAADLSKNADGQRDSAAPRELSAAGGSPRRRSAPASRRRAPASRSRRAASE